MLGARHGGAAAASGASRCLLVLPTAASPALPRPFASLPPASPPFCLCLFPFPLPQVSSDETQRLIKMEEVLHGRVIGQEEAVTAIARAIRRARVGLKNPNRPIASFIFSGGCC